MPIRWAIFVQRLRQLEFEGPYQGSKHPYMVKGDLVLTIPNPHKKEIGVDLLSRILKQAGIARDEWLKVG
ncbi:MAG: type II toxin-antitoxin system HicA family toxin [bacterium]|nr:type II toxin-antitoxin system HicA family toxin [bacterium]